MRDRPRCGACGQAMPPGAGRCLACGSAREASVDTVTVDLTPTMPGEARGRRAGTVAIVVLCLLAATVGLVGRESSDTGPGSAAGVAQPVDSTSTTTELEVGMLPGPVVHAWVIIGVDGRWVVADQPPGAGLLNDASDLSLLVGSSDGFFTIDLDSGAYTPVVGLAYELGATNSVIQVAGGVVIAEEGRAGVHSAPYDGPPAAVMDTPGRRLDAVPAAEADRVWLVTGDPRSGREASEVDLAGRHLTGPLALPADGVPVTGMTGGLLLHAPDGGYLLGPDGSLRRAADGDVATAVGSEVLHQTCDEHLRCGWFLTNAETSARRAVTGLDDAVHLDVPPNARSPDGTTVVLVVTRAHAGFDLAFLDVATASVARVPVGATDGVPTRLTWTPAGDRVFWLSAQHLHAHRVGDREPAVVAIRPVDYRVVIPFDTP